MVVAFYQFEAGGREMGWREWLEKLKLIDITPKFEGKQIGAINVNIENKTENKTYNFNIRKEG